MLLSINASKYFNLLSDRIDNFLWNMSVCSGCVDKTELKEAFERMDVHVTDKEVDLLLKRYMQKILNTNCTINTNGQQSFYFIKLQILNFEFYSWQQYFIVTFCWKWIINIIFPVITCCKTNILWGYHRAWMPCIWNNTSFTFLTPGLLFYYSIKKIINNY